MFVSLSALENISLGFKSLQNTFYYVDQNTIDTYDIETRFLKPIIMRRGYGGSCLFPVASDLRNGCSTVVI